MPTYEYKCESCNQQLEVEQSIKDDPLETCPHCHSASLKKLISRSSFVLKGSGWAADNYSSTGTNK
jgi:putative FmdB family regulatory protein